MTTLSLPPSPARQNKAPALLAMAAVFCCVPLLVIGCDPEPVAPPQPAEPARPEAEVKFEHIYEDINRLVGTEEGSKARDPGPTGGANTESTHTVEHKLIPPAKEGDTYRGYITITRRYTVTMFTFNRENETQQSGDQQQAGDEFSGDPEFSDGLDQFDSTGVRTSPLSGGSPMKTRQGETVTKFELEYIDGSWVLHTQPDPDAEKSIQSAFEYALRRQ